jgi:hypothetical protein
MGRRHSQCCALDGAWEAASSDPRGRFSFRGLVLYCGLRANLSPGSELGLFLLGPFLRVALEWQWSTVGISQPRKGW